MGILDRAKQAAEEAATNARALAEGATEAARQKADRTGAALSDPAATEKAHRGLEAAGQGARKGLGLAKRGLSTAVDRIDPGILADVVIKATALQEKANRSLRQKNSPYRISEIAISAAIPPNITFSIARIDDAIERIVERAIESSDLLAEAGVAAGPVLALDGTAIDEDAQPVD